MNEQTIQLIRDLAAQLGVATEKLIAIFAHQAAVTAVCYSALSLPFFCWAAWSFYASLHASAERKSEFDDLSPRGVARLMTAILFSVGVLILLVNAADLLSPEAAAIEKLLRLVRHG